MSKDRGRFSMQRVWKRLMVLLAVGMITGIDTATAVAQAAPPLEEEGKSYGLAWLAIVLVVALGIFITLRPAGRSEEVKRISKDEL